MGNQMSSIFWTCFHISVSLCLYGYPVVLKQAPNVFTDSLCYDMVQE
jgi:hypothetical protein